MFSYHDREGALVKLGTIGDGEIWAISDGKAVAMLPAIETEGDNMILAMPEMADDWMMLIEGISSEEESLLKTTVAAHWSATVAATRLVIYLDEKRSGNQGTNSTDSFVTPNLASNSEE